MLTATTVPLTDGLVAHGLPGQGRLDPTPDTARYDNKHAHTDVLVIGAGPAGLTAAQAAARSGARVILLDDQDAPGGALLGSNERIDGAPAGDWIATVTAELAANPDVQVLTRTNAFGVYDDGAVRAVQRRTDHLDEAPTTVLPGIGSGGSAPPRSSWPPAPTNARSCSPTTTAPASCSPGPPAPTCTATGSWWAAGSSCSPPTTAPTPPPPTSPTPGCRSPPWSTPARRHRTSPPSCAGTGASPSGPAASSPAPTAPTGSPPYTSPPSPATARRGTGLRRPAGLRRVEPRRAPVQPGPREASLRPRARGVPARRAASRGAGGRHRRR